MSSPAFRQNVLTQLQQRRSSFLPPLMELSESPEQGPPVPAKDPQYRTHSRRNSSRVLSGSMNIDRPSMSSTAPQSGSKRKRASHGEHIHDLRNGLLETYDDINDNDQRGQTPNKRPRSNANQSDGESDDLSDGEEATPANQRNLRRKKGSRNLSNLNLRHAAFHAKLPPPQLSPRESRFQEGSLNDKPSQQPPSVFTRPPRTDSGNLDYVDELMANYHNGMLTPAKTSYDANVLRPQDVTSATASQKENDGMHRFGQSKSWYSNFHPVVLWNSLFKETKEELTRQNMLEAERKARLKAEAEARYAQMKHTGQLGLQRVTMGTGNTGVSTARDSGIAFDNAASEHHRTTSYGSQLLASNEDAGHDGSEAPEPPRTLRGRLSRLALRKPSMSSLTGTMKRTKSDFNLAASYREAVSSVSPVKTESDQSVSVLTRSTSKYDLRRQHRLSKKVSDLESKLQKARSELEGALAQATPAPNLGNRYERWTPVSSLRRQPKFVPGALPTLPSERLLFADPADVNADEATIRVVHSSRPRQRVDLEKAFDDIHDDDDTVRSARGCSHVRAKDMIEQSAEKADSGAVLEARKPENQDRDQPQTVGDGIDFEAAPSQTLVKFASSTVLELPKQPAPDVLVAKLKAIDASVKASKKPVKIKKRQTVDDDSGTFRPRKDEDADDDAEWDEAQHGSAKKKRKSTGKTENSPQSESKRNPGAVEKQKSPASKLSKTITSTGKTSKAKDGKCVEQVGQTVEPHFSEDVDMGDALGSEDELAGKPSIEEENVSLEPLYEVEEEVMPLKEEPTEPTAIATPARHGQGSPRSRSVSPYKRTCSVQPAAEERMLTRAANAAQASRPSRSTSPPPAKGHSEQVSIIKNAVKITPGLGDIPNLPPDLPKGVSVSIAGKKAPQKKSHRKKSHASKENFEWPEDVF